MGKTKGAISTIHLCIAHISVINSCRPHKQVSQKKKLHTYKGVDDQHSYKWSNTLDLLDKTIQTDEHYYFEKLRAYYDCKLSLIGNRLLPILKS